MHTVRIMGGAVSTEAFDPAHVRIYASILQIQNAQTRSQMIQTCLAGPEYISTAKRAGVYSFLLGYVSAVQNGYKPNLLPGEQGQQTMHLPRIVQQQRPTSGYHQAPHQQLTTYKEKQDGPSWMQISKTPQQKMVSYFASCLEVLGIQDEVSLNEETLKKAYKQAAIRSHPDKGGSEEHFEAVTRAYAYLTEILRRIQGGREKAPGVVEAPQIIDTTRKEESKAWQHAEPIRLNPKNLNMDAFNKMFETTHIPDPDNDGYGDWLKTSENDNTPKFGGKFNRDVFNNMFDKEAAKQSRGRTQQNNALIQHPDAMAMLPIMGVEIGRDRPETYTAAPNSKQQFTDLRAAYTTDSTFSGQVANVRVEERRIDTYRAQREKAPAPLQGRDLEMLHQSETELKRREEMRQRRKAERDVVENSYFERMKQLVITDGR